MKAIKSLFAILLLFGGTLGYAVAPPERESVGRTYPIVEPDFLEEIKEKGSTVDWKKVFDRKEFEKKIKNFQPKNMSRLPRASEGRVRLIDMTYTLDRDVLDAKGNVLYPAGYQFNPLEYLPVGSTLPTLVVIDGTDKDQVDWLKGTPYIKDLGVRILLSDGHYFDLSEDFGFQVFYLMDPVKKRFQLEKVPCVIRRAGNMMHVEEIFVPMVGTKEQTDANS